MNPTAHSQPEAAIDAMEIDNSETIKSRRALASEMLACISTQNKKPGLMSLRITVTLLFTFPFPCFVLTPLLSVRSVAMPDMIYCTRG